MVETSPVALIIVAAGRGTRAGGGLPKVYRDLAGQTVLRRTLGAFAQEPRITHRLVAIHPDDRAHYDAAVAGLNLPAPVMGGDTRQQSVRAGLEALAGVGFQGKVLVHDAARALVSPALIARVIDALKDKPAVVPALPVADSLRRAHNFKVAEEISRDHLWQVQTPQGFDFATLLAAHVKAQNGATDDGEIARAAGVEVHVVEGDPRNIKLTTVEDFAFAQTLLGGTMISRTAQGFDVHGFEAGDHLYLCGVKIAHDQKLKGHSDADVGLHALTDALLGTISAGDIGQHFPPSDPQWKGAASDQFLRHAAQLVAARGGVIDHVDVTIIAEAPKVGPHRVAMQARVAQILSVRLDQVSIKATTTEGLGFTGRREGIAAQAMATVRLPAPVEAQG